MSAPAAADKSASAGSAPGFGVGRSGLVIAALMLAIAIYLTAGVVTMEVPPGAKSPGPKLFPGILAGACYVLAALITWQLLRQPEDPLAAEPLDEYGGEPATFSDWRTVGICIAGFAAFAALLVPLGWIIAAAILFWSTAWAMGSRKGWVDVAIAVIFASAIQVAFSLGLGLSLPPGVLKGLF